MTKSKMTKKALFLSMISLLICFSMLLGTTFAWFTDTVTSAGNIIQSGTLDVDLVDADGNTLAGQVIEFVTDDNRAQNEILWEPGCTYETEPVYVVNNGNLALKYQIVINGINGNAKLLEAIDWTITIDGEPTDLSSFEGTLYADGVKKSGKIVLSGHMKEEAGNEYQNLKVEGVSITVYATQLTYEKDSFDDQYDAKATFLNKDADGAWLINNMDELFFFASDVNSGNSYLGETVKLTADINLAGYNWVPIGSGDVNGTWVGFNGIFDGQNHTISNVKITKSGGWNGIFGLVGRGTSKVEESISNLTVKNIVIEEANRMSAGIVGQLYGNIENCHVENVTINAIPNMTASGYDNGDKIGGVVGWFGDNGNNHYIRNCTAKNVTLKAYRDVAGIVGYIGTTSTVENCSVDTVSITIDQATNHYGVKDANAGGIVGRIYNTPVTVQNNTEANVTLVVPTFVSTADGLANALAAGGDVIYAGSDLDIDSSLNVTGSLTITNATIDADAAGEIVVDGGTLTLGKGAVLSVDGEMPAAGVIRVINNSEIVLAGAEISGCDNNGTGVLINVAAGAKMTIEDGTVISGNAVAGSGNTPHALIKVCGELIMNGGEITNNEFAHKALISIEGGKFVMNGGTIANNTFTGTGATSVFYFFTSAAKFEMNGGTITDNNLGSHSNSAVFNSSTVNAADVLVVNGGTVNADKFAYVRDFNSVSIASAANVSGSVYAFWDGITKDVNEIKE